MLLIWGFYDGPEGLFQHHPSGAHMIPPPPWAHMIQTLPGFIFTKLMKKTSLCGFLFPCKINQMGQLGFPPNGWFLVLQLRFRNLVPQRFGTRELGLGDKLDSWIWVSVIPVFGGLRKKGHLALAPNQGFLDQSLAFVRLGALRIQDLVWIWVFREILFFFPWLF